MADKRTAPTRPTPQQPRSSASSAVPHTLPPTPIGSGPGSTGTPDVFSAPPPPQTPASSATPSTPPTKRTAAATDFSPANRGGNIPIFPEMPRWSVATPRSVDPTLSAPGVERLRRTWNEDLWPLFTRHYDLIENPHTRAIDAAQHMLVLMGQITGATIELLNVHEVNDNGILAPTLQAALVEAISHNFTSGRVPRAAPFANHPTPAPDTAPAPFAPSAHDLVNNMSALAGLVSTANLQQQDAMKSLVALQNAVSGIGTRLERLERRPGNPPAAPRPNPPAPPTQPSAPPARADRRVRTEPPPAAAPASYADAAAAPPAERPPSIPPPNRPRTPTNCPATRPPPTTKAKFPTLVVNFKGNPIPASQRHTDRTTTQEVRAFLTSVPTAVSLRLQAASWNVKGNCVMTFDRTSRVHDLIDQHAGALARVVCQGRDVSTARVSPRTKLQVSMVPVRDSLPGSAPFSNAELLSELTFNRSIKDTDLASDVSFTKARPDITDELKHCPITFWVHDQDGKCSKRILDAPVFLFGKRFRVQRYKPLPAFSQCDRCQKLGHTSNGCKGRVACATCAGNHKTSDHRARCGSCATEGTTSNQCPHPSACVNCAGDHPSTASRLICPAKRAFARPPGSDDGMDTDPETEL